MRDEEPALGLPEHARLGLWLALAASVLGTAASLVASRGLEWLASAGLLCGVLVYLNAVSSRRPRP